jgi:thymidylate synthase (FAD)
VIKVFYNPQVYLIAKPQLNWSAINQYLIDTESGVWQKSDEAGDGELLCEFMGRLCYGSFGPRQGRTNTSEYLNNILAQQHGSVLEHANYSFVVTQCTRGYTHQQVRHRAGWAYSQESTHFIEYGENEARLAFPGIPIDEVETCAEAAKLELKAYAALVVKLKQAFDQRPRKKKLVCGAARVMLPASLESKLGFTANIRGLRWFTTLRGSDHNTAEIRLVAIQVLRFMQAECPALFSDYEVYEAEDGYPAIRGGGKE